MTEIFAFLAVWMLSWPALIGLCVLGVIFEANDAHGWAMFTGILTAAVSYFFFNVSLALLLELIAAYFVLGFVWMVWRYKRHADKVVEENKDASDSRKEFELQRLQPTQMLGTLTTWVLIWPFSMIENVTGDLINLVQSAITGFFKGILNKIHGSAAQRLGIPPANK